MNLGTLFDQYDRSAMSRGGPTIPTSMLLQAMMDPGRSASERASFAQAAGHSDHMRVAQQEMAARMAAVEAQRTQQGQQFQQDAALRGRRLDIERELGMMPYQQMTAAQQAQNLLGREQLASNERMQMLPYQQMTAAQQAQNQLGRADLDLQERKFNFSRGPEALKMLVLQEYMPAMLQSDPSLARKLYPAIHEALGVKSAPAAIPSDPLSARLASQEQLGARGRGEAVDLVRQIIGNADPYWSLSTKRGPDWITNNVGGPLVEALMSGQITEQDIPDMAPIFRDELNRKLLSPGRGFFDGLGGIPSIFEPSDSDKQVARIEKELTTLHPNSQKAREYQTILKFLRQQASQMPH